MPPYHRRFVPEMWNTNRPGRNRVLVGAGALAAILAVGLGVKIVAGGDEDDEAADTSPLPLPPRLGRAIYHYPIGANVRKPRDWTHSRAPRSLTLRSPDRTVILSVGLPPGTDRSAAILRTGVATLRRQYRKVEVLGSDARRVANLPTSSVVTAATNSRGVRLRILTSAPQGRKRAWLVQIFSAAGTNQKRLAEAQAAIATLGLAG